MSDKMKHLEFIQAIITRMNKNSFCIKGWMVTIVSALLALAASNKNVVYIYIGIATTIVFWFLDSYYLQQERKFRGLYNDVAGLSKKAEKVEIRTYDMNIKAYKGGKYSYFNVCFSITIALLYIAITIGLIIISITLY